jgi:hypothetical protein
VYGMHCLLSAVWSCISEKKNALRCRISSIYTSSLCIARDQSHVGAHESKQSRYFDCRARPACILLQDTRFQWQWSLIPDNICRVSPDRCQASPRPSSASDQQKVSALFVSGLL